MPLEISMPQLSDTMSEGTVVKWVKKEGEKVKLGEIIAEVETDKATMEMEAFESGTLAQILVKEGGRVGVGTPIAVLATGKESAEDARKNYTGGAKPVSAATTTHGDEGATASEGSAKVARGADKAQAGAALASSSQTPRSHSSAARTGSTMTNPSQSLGASATFEEAISGEIHEPDNVGHGATREPPTAVPPMPPHGNGRERLRASPLARRLAADKGIDLGQVRGTGPGGRVVQRDVLEFTPPAPKPAATPREPAKAPPTPARVATGQKEVIALDQMRLTIAKRLQASKQNIPHFYESVDVDVEDLSALRVRMNELLEPEKVRLSLGDFIAKAVATALVRHPALNATFDGAQITRHGDVNLGAAVALPNGLIVPVLRNINQMGLKEIRLRSMDLVERARAQRLKQDEMRGATFTVSNLGTYGVKEFSAIINPPEVGILAVAAAEKRPVVRGGAIVARTVMTLTLSADHRVVDGATAAEFLRTLKGLLEEPGMMLA